MACLRQGPQEAGYKEATPLCVATSTAHSDCASSVEKIPPEGGVLWMKGLVEYTPQAWLETAYPLSRHTPTMVFKCHKHTCAYLSHCARDLSAMAT